MKNMNTRTLTRVALLVAIELVMKAVGLGSVPMGPLYMSFLTLPIAVGAITMGPAVGAILGGVFGAVSIFCAKIPGKALKVRFMGCRMCDNTATGSHRQREPPGAGRLPTEQNRRGTR